MIWTRINMWMWQRFLTIYHFWWNYSQRDKTNSKNLPLLRQPVDLHLKIGRKERKISGLTYLPVHASKLVRWWVPKSHIFGVRSLFKLVSSSLFLVDQTPWKRKIEWEEKFRSVFKNTLQVVLVAQLIYLITLIMPIFLRTRLDSSLAFISFNLPITL